MISKLEVYYTRKLIEVDSTWMLTSRHHLGQHKHNSVENQWTRASFAVSDGASSVVNAVSIIDAHFGDSCMNLDAITNITVKKKHTLHDCLCVRLVGCVTQIKQCKQWMRKKMFSFVPFVLKILIQDQDYIVICTMSFTCRISHNFEKVIYSKRKFCTRSHPPVLNLLIRSYNIPITAIKQFGPIPNSYRS